ncbi:ferritin-like domain-domain-containing protein [Clohesyomyces aquaticus]|uniref:Ferritin-like domain-domain-containing protein n=1 Tax=Clohesyomyces aquaticus TaxID=1231657 RepID=A0A1Y1ZZJ3_9PLEO|nr:ferritin-like domain-domain-containing protein [Clohesyomyces aquaticus]
MPSVRTALQWLLVAAPAMTLALPAQRMARQEAASSAAAPAASAPAAPAPPPPAAGGLTDVDILQFALTAEHLESAFYQQGFAKFPAADFKALGLSDANIKSLQQVGQTEATHVSTLLSVISQAGAQPVQPCQYNFAFTDAKGMVATARVLEAVGVSAYLGAAPLINSSDVLAAAATIATVESRHQTAIRIFSGAEPVPAAFDTPLGPRAVFTLAAQFITSCPEGSNLAITPFPAIALQNPEKAVVGQQLALADASMPAGAQFCAFVAPGGPVFEPLTNGNCVVPQNLAGEVYMMITKSKSVADAEVLAGPSVIQPS